MRMLVTLAILSLSWVNAQDGIPDTENLNHLINSYGLCLASYSNWGHNGNSLAQWECLPERGQQWQFDRSTPSSYICNNFQKCITAASSGNQQSFVQLDPITSGSDDQTFTFENSDLKGYFYIKTKEGKCLSSDPTLVTAFGAPITPRDCVAWDRAQMWRRGQLTRSWFRWF